MFVRGYAEIKIAAARANRSLRTLSSEQAQAIEAAASEVSEGNLLEHFPIRVVPVGGSTATNMNVNEVIAERATQLLGSGAGLRIHPNDHVNRSQSTNDTYPVATKLLLYRQSQDVSRALRRLVASHQRQAERTAGLTRLGRTSWQDAVEVSVSAGHQAQATVAERLASQFDRAAEDLTKAQLGGTALGTGIGAPSSFGELAVTELKNITGVPLHRSPDIIDSFVHADAYSALADVAARSATILSKQANDLILLSSGPRGGLSEVHLAALQPGSSIMPGKVNPAIPNLVVQTSFSIRAAATAVGQAVCDGSPDFNGNSPTVVANLSPALTELESSVAAFALDCIDRLEWNAETLERRRKHSYDSRIVEAESRGYEAVAASTQPN